MAEIQFGESSSGAAIVQGTFLGADQGGSRSQGMPGQRGNGGNSKQTLEDGKIALPICPEVRFCCSGADWIEQVLS